VGWCEQRRLVILIITSSDPSRSGRPRWLQAPPQPAPPLGRPAHSVGSTRAAANRVTLGECFKLRAEIDIEPRGLIAVAGRPAGHQLKWCVKTADGRRSIARVWHRPIVRPRLKTRDSLHNTHAHSSATTLNIVSPRAARAGRLTRSAHRLASSSARQPSDAGGGLLVAARLIFK
jgi:hypothetical protein